MDLWQEGGKRAFFKGIGGRIGRIAPQMSIAMLLYEVGPTPTLSLPPESGRGTRRVRLVRGEGRGVST